MNELSSLEDIEGYRRLFTDPIFWEPYIHQAFRQQALAPNGPVRIGVPGTCPTFIVAERWVIKFFGRLFEGGKSFWVEREAARLAALDPAVRAVPVIAAGELGGSAWSWPYLIYPLIPGVSLGEQVDQITGQGWLEIAAEMGRMIHRLHALPLDGSPVFPNHLREYRQFLENQRADCLSSHQAWGSLPAHLLSQLEDFLPPLDDLVDTSQPAHLIHADLTRDHLLGQVQSGRWTTLALIDFGDAMTGSLLYELAALHFDLFRADRRLLSVFLDAYGLNQPLRRELPRRAMAVALLHQFNLMELLTDEMRQMPSLEALSAAVWGL